MIDVLKRLAELDAQNPSIIKENEQGVAEHNDTFDPKSHQYKTTMKHAKDPTVQQRMAAHDIQPGIKGYRDRIDMIKDLERTGKLKKDEVASEGVADDYHDLRNKIEQILIKAYSKYGSRDDIIDAAKPAAQRAAQEMGLERYFDEIWMSALAGHDIETNFGDNDDGEGEFNYTDYSMRKGERGVAEGDIVDVTRMSSRGVQRMGHADNDDLSRPAMVTWGKNKSKNFDNYSDAVKFKNNLERKYPGLKAQVFEDVKQENLEECGMMDTMGGMSQPRTPASINMTAASGEELSGMLKDIMSLAGMKTVGQDDLGMDHEPMTLTTEPISAVGPAASDNELMRSMLDKMNPADGDEEDGEEETDETVDSVPADPNGAQPFDANQYAHQENQPGQGDRMDGDRPKAFATMEQQLMAEYKKFISE